MELNIMPFLPPAVPSSALGPSFRSLRECIRPGQTVLYVQRNMRRSLATIAAVEKQ